jgi:hypothetical protein
VDFPGGQIRTGFARAPNDAIAVDEQNRPWHWDGTRWSAITLPIFGGFPIGQFWGTAPDDVWAVGGAIFHWDGDSWQRVWAGSQGWVSFVGGSARDDAWFAIRQRDLRTTVLHWDGSSFTELDTFDRLPVAITSTGPTDVWLILIGEVRHYDGVNWNVEPIDWYLLKVLGVRGAGAFLATWHGHIYQSR